MRSWRLDVPEDVLEDLDARLRATRLPDPSPHDGWAQGLPLDVAHEVLQHWCERYDWRATEARLNGFGQHVTTIDGVEIHFLHVRSSEAAARPLVLTHGWPGSVIEFLELIGPLTDPVAHGGGPSDAFDVVVPSLPGYGFSSAPREPGWTVERIADAWVALVEQLGYASFLAHGGDWGSVVSTAMAVRSPEAVSGVHLTMPIAPRTDDEPTPAEQQALRRYKQFRQDGQGYAVQQATRPQTLGYGLADSPWGQAAWILEKFHEWTDPTAGRFGGIALDTLLDNVMTYWLSNAGASSARLYYESWGNFDLAPVHVPTGVSRFPYEVVPTSRRWVESRYTDLRTFRVHEAGGHFPALEQPAALVDDLREFARTL